MKRDLNDRLFRFAANVLRCIKKTPNTSEFRVIKYQLIKSATSSGANYEESQAGSSRADFSNKVRIALREMRESNYWLRLVNDVYPEYNSEKIRDLVDESHQLMNILGAILVKSKSS